MKRSFISANSQKAAANLSRRQSLKLFASATVAAGFLPIAGRSMAAEELPLVYTWEGYDAPELYKSFMAAYGTVPRFSLFAGLDEAYLKLRSGFEADICTPGAEVLGRWRESDLLLPIETSKLSHWSDLFANLTSQKPAVEDGIQWGVPFAWGAFSVLFRSDLAPEYVDNNTWEILWDPKYTGRIAVKDAAAESVVMAALVAGIDDPFDMSDAEIQKIKGLLVAQRPLLRYYWSDTTTLEQSLAAGEIVAAFGWSSSYKQLQQEGVPVEFMVPKEGLITWIDFLTLLKGGQASEESKYAVLDAMLAPESGAFLLSEYALAAPNRRAYDLVDPGLARTLGLEDPAAVADAGILLRPFSRETEQKVVLMFEKVKAGA